MCQPFSKSHVSDQSWCGSHDVAPSDDPTHRLRLISCSFPTRAQSPAEFRHCLGHNGGPTALRRSVCYSKCSQPYNTQNEQNSPGVLVVLVGMFNVVQLPHCWVTLTCTHFQSDSFTTAEEVPIQPKRNNGQAITGKSANLPRTPM